MSSIFFNIFRDERTFITKGTIAEWSKCQKTNLKDIRDNSGRNLIHILFTLPSVNELDMKLSFCMENDINPSHKDKTGQNAFDYAFKSINKILNIRYIKEFDKINENELKYDNYLLSMVYNIVMLAKSLIVILPEKINQENESLFNQTKELINIINNKFVFVEPLSIEVEIEKKDLMEIFTGNENSIDTVIQKSKPKRRM